LRIGIVALLVGLAPAVLAIWRVRTFVTQDGPAHLYNAYILAQSLDPSSPFRDVFQVRWEPLPNWAGHVTLLGLETILPPRWADRVMTTLTLVAIAIGVFRLRIRVGGTDGLPASAFLAALLAMNVTWLLGFTSFLLGAAVFPVTLGAWWVSRDSERPWRRALALAALMTLGYFCHLVSLGLTALGLVVLEAFTPGPRRARRALSTAAGLIPLGPLALIYLSLMRSGGGKLSPEWKHLENVLSLRSWIKQLSWVDPISIARRDVLPFLEGNTSPWFALASPVVWLSAALLVLIVVAIAGRADNRYETRGWWVLGAILIIGGACSPDTLGASHGEYLQQRIVLLGLVALAPVLPFDARRARPATMMLAVAVALQAAFVCDYARTSERMAGSIARDIISRSIPGSGKNPRVIMMLSGIRTNFRANPILHADGLLGIGTDRILWNDYETRYYYFPVRFREGLEHPDTVELEQIALSEEPDRVERWARLLERARSITDVVVMWGDDPAMDEVTERWFRVVLHDGPVRIYTSRGRD